MFNNKAVLLLAVLAAASSRAAIPEAARCGYEPDGAHITCHAGNTGYPDGAPVTYNMRDVDEAAAFMRRSDALATIEAGIANVARRAEVNSLPVDASGSVVGQSWHASGAPNDNYVSDVIREGNKGGSVIGSSCHFGTSRRGMECVKARADGTVEPEERDLNPHAEAGKRDVITDQSVLGADCYFGNQRRDGNAKVLCKQLSHPTYGPTGYSGVIGLANLRRDTITSDQPGRLEATPGGADITSYKAITGATCHYGNTRRAPDGASFTCTQTTAPLYGPNGGSPTLIAARRDVGERTGVEYDMRRASDVVDFHHRRAQWHGADASWRRAEQPCDNTPVGPIGPQATYVTRRDVPQPTQGFARRQQQPQAQRRCSNLPIKPVGPSVTYISKADWMKQQGLA